MAHEHGGFVTCQFLKEGGIHIIDCSGKIDFQEGLSRMEQLEKHFLSHVSDGVPFKVLLDVRNASWESPQIHDALAKTARQTFDFTTGAIRGHVAILNSRYEGFTFENERWFTSKDEALVWLLKDHPDSDSS